MNDIESLRAEVEAMRKELDSLLTKREVLVKQMERLQWVAQEFEDGRDEKCRCFS